MAWKIRQLLELGGLRITNVGPPSAGTDAATKTYVDSGDSSAAVHIASTSGVHGVTGNVVGTTDTKTLTNKTISGASNTLSNIADAAITGMSASKLIGTTLDAQITGMAASKITGTVSASQLAGMSVSK